MPDLAPALSLVTCREPHEELPAGVEVIVTSPDPAARGRAVRAARGAVVVSLAPGCTPLAELPGLARLFDEDPWLGFAYGGAVWPYARGGPALPAYRGRRAFLEDPFEPAVLALRRDAAREFPVGDHACLHAAAIAALPLEVVGRPLPRPVAELHEARPPLPRDCSACADPCQVLRRRQAPSWAAPRWRLSKLAPLLTTRCNLDCDYCFTRRYRWDVPRETALRGIYEAFDLQAERVVLTGGEPTIYPHFDEAFALASRLGFKIDILSNGFGPRWTDERLDRVLAHPELRIGLAIQGQAEEDFDDGRGPGAYRTIVEFVQRVRARRPDTTLFAIVVATRDNVRRLTEIARFCLEELRVTEVRVDRVVRTGNAADRFESGEELARVYLEEAARAEQTFPGRVGALSRSFAASGCPVLDDPNYIEVMPVGNGRVPACAYFLETPDFDLGQADEPLEVLVSAERVQRARRRVQVLFRHRERYIAERGIFTCVECVEAWRELGQAGQLEAELAAADAAAGPPVAHPARAFPAPRLLDPPRRRGPVVIG